MSGLGQLFKLVAHPSVMIILLFPRLFRLFPTLLQRDVHIKTNHDILKLIDKSVREHQETVDVNEPRDFIDAYLSEIEQGRKCLSCNFKVKRLVNEFSWLLIGCSLL